MHNSPPDVRIAVVDDHPVMLAGFTRLSEFRPQVKYVAGAETVASLLAGAPVFDVVLLDLQLADGSQPADNVAALRARGAQVLVYADRSHVAWVAEAVAAGATGVVGKSASMAEVADAIIAAWNGELVLTAELAEALARDAVLRPELSEREVEVLRLVSLGLADKQIARTMGISEDTVKEYLRRIRAKYTERGRPATSRVDLFRRSLEDGVSDDPGAHARFQ